MIVTVVGVIIFLYMVAPLMKNVKAAQTVHRDGSTIVERV